MPDDGDERLPAPPLPPNWREVWEYLRRITAAHNQQPRYMETVALSVQPVADALPTVRGLNRLFDLDTATGVALDALGDWIGIGRRVTVEDVNFFSWDSDDLELGWDVGEWAGGGEGSYLTYLLDDEHYRLVLKARVKSNHWDGTKDGAYDAWHSYFRPLGYEVKIEENFDRALGFFSWDTVQLGWDQAYWDRAGIPPAIDFLSWDTVGLGWDQAFWDNTPPDYVGLPDLSVLGRCTGIMWMRVWLVGPPPSALMWALFTQGFFDLKPAGVGIEYRWTAAWTPDATLFAWNTPGNGWNQGRWTSAT